MIVAKGLTKSFGSIPAVDSIDFEIPQGSIVGFLGPNGAGKSTTIRMIAGFLRPTAGSVSVDGLDSADHSLEVRRGIGYLPESTPLYTEMRVEEYLRFRARLYGLRRNERAAAVDRAIDRCWLKEVRRKVIAHLSKGFRQRVGLAAALLHEPKLVILDEPSIGLDPAQVQAMRSLIRELTPKQTVLFSSHILTEVQAVCDRILMIARGRLYGQGTIDEIIRNESDRSTFIVETDCPNCASVLENLDRSYEVTVQSLSPPWVQAHVTADDADARTKVSQALLQAGHAVRELTSGGNSLEKYFIRMMAEAELEFSQRLQGLEEAAS